MSEKIRRNRIDLIRHIIPHDEWEKWGLDDKGNIMDEVEEGPPEPEVPF